MNKGPLFKDFIKTAFDNGPYGTDDIIAFVLPLFKEVLSFHEEGMVAPFENEESLYITRHHVDIDESRKHAARSNKSRVISLTKKIKTQHFDVVGTLKLDTDISEQHSQFEDASIQLNKKEPIERPVYLPGYGCFEMFVGHHDDQTDIFCLGLILGSITLGLDLNDEEDLKTFVAYRTNPVLYNDRVHPTVSALIKEMTALDRHERCQDLYDAILRLENYRDFDPEKQMDLAKVTGWKSKDISSRGQYILNKLRNRLFDTSRRNRLLYYKSNMRFLNLTVSSVPMVLHYESIRPELLFTWNEEIGGRVRDQKDILLNKYLRFEDHKYLGSSLDKIRVESQHDIQEYGFSQLKLVIAFLNWNNLKEDKNERIQSPILLVPVELKKNKKLKEDHFVLKVLSNEAEVNPILSNYLADLYGIRLPDFIDLEETSVQAFFEKLKEQIDAARQGIVINYIDKPRIRLIHSVARQTVTSYSKRLRRATGMDSYKNINYSYEPEHYKPLGLEIFRQRIQPKASFLEFLVNEDISISSHHLTGEVKERELFELAEGEQNPYSWDFDVCNIVLGNFNYKKMSLVRDYNQVIDENIHHHVFEELFSDQPKKYDSPVPDLNKPDEWYHVITADPTQTRAILQGRTNESYIIQGPPGTGKSQTITNLIADFVARGKTILFVCEKRAALDVVFHRLKQQGLDDLCCYIHDSQGDKREFIKNLKQTYEYLIKNKADLTKIEAERNEILRQIDGQFKILKDFHFTNNRVHDKADVEVRKLIERLIELRQFLPELKATEEHLVPDYREWKNFGNAISNLCNLLEDAGGEPSFSLSPFSKIKEELFQSNSGKELVERLVSHSLENLETIVSTCKALDVDPEVTAAFRQIGNLVEFSILLYPFIESDNLKLADPTHAEAKRFAKGIKEYKSLAAKVEIARNKNIHWKNKFSEQDTENALLLARKHEKSIFNFFNGSWRQLKRQLNEAYDFSQHQVRPSYTAVLELLQQEHNSVRSLEESMQKLESAYALKNIMLASESLERIMERQGETELQYLLRHASAGKTISALYKIQTVFYTLDAELRQLLFDHEKKTLNEITDDLETLKANLDNLHELFPSLSEFATMPLSLKQMMRNLPLNPKETEAAMARKTLHHIYQDHKNFSSTDLQVIEKAVNKIRSLFEKLLKINSAYIKARIHEKFLAHIEWSTVSASQLTAEQKIFKKNYTEGRKILENEFGKSMRYKSIRELAARESGMILKDIKPIWLMSPLSVSDSLPVHATSFDVVIFDEASQITPEEGVPSLYRAPQTIIVGDDKQMPPTNFFSTKAEDPDDLEKYTDQDDEILSDDADSLLVQGSRKLNSVMLGWHYRSRYETLISYSNHAFYNANLLTIPDRTIHHAEKPTIEVKAAEQASAFVDALFDRSLSYHYLPASIYEQRVNVDEAKYIASLVKELLLRKVPESIGVVAFSQEQQHEIEDALTNLASEDKVFEQLLEEAYNRTEDDQFVGLIIKNLENIQGDERDIIIMSVCYGYDSRKRMIMNFGPINKKGGEKRLNVIFSRAKKHMAVVSSIRHSDITNEYNEGANYFKQFLHYAEQVSIGNMEMARTILDGLVLRKNKTETVGRKMAVIKQIRQELEKLGYEVREEVGQSDFKCSLAVKKNKEDESYTLGILLDDDSHYNNANLLEQYYQRPEILKSFGWRCIYVFLKDWLHHPKRVMQCIIDRLNEEPKVEVEEETAFVLPTASVEEEPVKAEATVASSQPTLFDQLTFKKLTYTDGSSNKFWEVAVDGSKLIIRFGRIGSRGQTQVKTFSNETSASQEKDKLIQEKLAKGYRE